MNDEFPVIIIVGHQTCSMFVLSVISALHHVQLFMDRILLLLVPVETEVDPHTASKVCSDSTRNEQVKTSVSVLLSSEEELLPACSNSSRESNCHDSPERVNPALPHRQRPTTSTKEALPSSLQIEALHVSTFALRPSLHIAVRRHFASV